MRPTIHGDPRTQDPEEERAQRDMVARGKRLMAMRNRQFAEARVAMKLATVTLPTREG